MKNQHSVKALVAHNIKKYRKLNRMTQAVLAELADVSNTYIANIECGQSWISDKTLEKIAYALHTEIYLLFIPENDDKIAIDLQNERRQSIEYLNEKKEELCDYVKDFFTETFTQILP